MTVIGNGVDIVENKRIGKSIKNYKFLKRIYSNYEINQSKKVNNKASFFAKRFAAKEAFVKALGTGFRDDINFNDINVKNNVFGKPNIYLSNKIKKKIRKKFKLKQFSIFLSLSDENKHSIAYVIIDQS
tara:strand:+ start:46 stop:432 length:387 start_codon:yes stop_codon:yes gene_type:complete